MTRIQARVYITETANGPLLSIHPTCAPYGCILIGNGSVSGFSECFTPDAVASRLAHFHEWHNMTGCPSGSGK